MYCYLEFNLCYLKNLKLFSIRVKELFECIVLRKKKGDGLLLFKGIFLRNKSLSTLGDFRIKNAKIWKGNLYLTVIRSRNEMWCAKDDHSDTCYTCAKEL